MVKYLYISKRLAYFINLHFGPVYKDCNSIFGNLNIKYNDLNVSDYYNNYQRINAKLVPVKGVKTLIVISLKI